MLNYQADFETTTDPADCRVWGWGLVEIKANLSRLDVEIGDTLDAFIERISGESAVIFFHNLAFDGAFIFDWLLNNGYTHTDSENLKDGEFTTLISDTGKHYSAKVSWRDKDTFTEFHDSLKKLPMSVDRIAKAYKLEFEKLEIDYHEKRPIGHVLTLQEKRYIASDVIIVAMALHEQISRKMVKLTIGADSLHEFKSLFGNARFRKIFPELDHTVDKDIRQAYRGGWTYLPKYEANKLVGRGKVYDVNSLYPYVMREFPMPYGDPEWFNGVPEDSPHPQFVTSVTFTARLRKGFLPCIQIKRHSIFNDVEYLDLIDEPTTLAVTHVDLELWQKHYDMDILSFNGGWAFRECSGVFNEYIHKWLTIKENSDGGLREIAKLHLNSLYGKFATNTNCTGKYPYLDDDGVVQLKLGEDDTRDPVYTPVGVMITAYARMVTITAAQENYDRFLYADTDSIHLRGTEQPSGIIVGKQLGEWKHEYDFTLAKFMRSKRYMEIESQPCRDTCCPQNANLPHDPARWIRHAHIAGLPVAVQRNISLGQFNRGAVFSGKLLPRRVKGGIVLSDVAFSLN